MARRGKGTQAFLTGGAGPPSAGPGESTEGWPAGISDLDKTGRELGESGSVLESLSEATCSRKRVTCVWLVPELGSLGLAGATLAGRGAALGQAGKPGGELGTPRAQHPSSANIRSERAGPWFLL